MRKYIGVVEIVNDFYNFRPLYMFQDGTLSKLSEDEIRELLPKSEKRNIWFAYDRYDDGYMRAHFNEDIPVVFEFSLEELEINSRRDGTINPTGYKVNVADFLEKGSIQELDSIGIYRLLGEYDINNTPGTIELDAYGLEAGLKVFIRDTKKNLYMGPYEVAKRALDQTYIAASELKDKKYVLSGFSPNACTVIDISIRGEVFYYLLPNEGAAKQYVDLSDDRVLFEAFKDSISSQIVGDGTVDITDIKKLEALFKESPFITLEDKDLGKKRLQRVVDYLSQLSETEDALKYISEIIGNSFGEIVKKYQDTEAFDGIITAIIEHNPDLLTGVTEYRVVKERIGILEEQERNLNNIVESLNLELEDHKSKESQNYDNESALLDQELYEKKDELQQLINEIQIKKGLLAQYETLEDIQEEISFLKEQQKRLEKGNDNLSSNLEGTAKALEERITGEYVDGLIMNRLQTAMYDYNRQKEQDYLHEKCKAFCEIQPEKATEDLVDYLCQLIMSVRPQYDKNTIINIFICLAQNFLTIFSGEPGGGKTSICNIIGQVLGLRMFGNGNERYIPVSVERGWTSKRDFIGYYNPITKQYNKNNKLVFEALQIMDIEKKNNIKDYPLIVLLDEANLSPMEYYWADFMNLCDDIRGISTINIGEDMVLELPETLRFFATINNDHTTEILSPRLVDRAAIITLPRVTNINVNNDDINIEQIHPVSWDSLTHTFGYSINESMEKTAEVSMILKEVFNHLKENNIDISPRVEKSINKYCAVGKRVFEKNSDESKRNPDIIALDYAVLQKILPKVNGFGDEYREWLKGLQKICNERFLVLSSSRIEEILKKGDNNMKYYQFFA